MSGSDREDKSRAMEHHYDRVYSADVRTTKEKQDPEQWSQDDDVRKDSREHSRFSPHCNRSAARYLIPEESIAMKVIVCVYASASRQLIPEKSQRAMEKFYCGNSCRICSRILLHLFRGLPSSENVEGSKPTLPG